MGGPGVGVDYWWALEPCCLFTMLLAGVVLWWLGEMMGL